MVGTMNPAETAEGLEELGVREKGGSQGFRKERCSGTQFRSWELLQALGAEKPGSSRILQP